VAAQRCAGTPPAASESVDRREPGGSRTRATPLKDRAYEAIKHHIITCRFAPGEDLNEAQVAGRLNLSLMPVRHALARLGLEGLVAIRPRKGIQVRPADRGELLQIVEARAINECHCARLAAERAAAEELAAMERVLRLTGAAVAARDAEAMMLLDREFHDLIARASKSGVLFDILRNLHDRAARFWFISLGEEGHQPGVLREHRKIYRAIAGRDPARAAEAMGRHIEGFRANVTAKLRGS
jgi:DNA-binding GntR family transcriptional regulator